MALFLRQLTKYFRPSPAPIPIARVPKISNTLKVTEAGPQRKLHHIPAYMLVIDESGSTGYQFRMAFGRKTTRIRAIQLAGERYLQQLVTSNPKQLVGLVGFSDAARLYHPLAPVGPAFRGLVKALNCLHPQTSTNLSAGLDLALAEIAKIDTTRGSLVLITDGAANVERHRLPKITKKARSLHVRIFAIGVGNRGDSEYDASLLKHLACRTGGQFNSVFSFEALQRALQRVS